MSNGSRRPAGVTIGVEKVTDLLSPFYEPQLQAIGLSTAQVADQTLEELQQSLGSINDAIQKPESFGTFGVAFAGEGELYVTKTRCSSFLIMQHSKQFLPCIPTMDVVLTALNLAQPYACSTHSA